MTKDEHKNKIHPTITENYATKIINFERGGLQWTLPFQNDDYEVTYYVSDQNKYRSAEFFILKYDFFPTSSTLTILKFLKTCCALKF
jgi:hypothetical protein